MALKTQDKFYLLIIAGLSILAAGLILYKLNEFFIQLDQENSQSISVQVKPPANKDFSWKAYRSQQLGFSLSYPEVLGLQETGGVLDLSHQVPFKNHGECDMKGETRTYNDLTDFHLRLQIFNGNVAQAAREFSSYLSAENFQDSTLKASPGFIDVYAAGDLRGFAIYEGVEGCGRVIYYFPVNNNQRTFVATHDMVQLFSGVVSSEAKNELLAVPGVINSEEAKGIFANILKSVQLNFVKF